MLLRHIVAVTSNDGADTNGINNDGEQVTKHSSIETCASICNYYDFLRNSVFLNQVVRHSCRRHA